MSTSETDEYVVDKCPCGSGHIFKYVTTQDNPWSSVDVSYRVSCSSCGGTWTAHAGYLSHAGDERVRDQAFKSLMVADKAIAGFVEPEIDEYFGATRFKSMAAQQREMARLQLRPKDIRTYRDGRNRGKKFSELCHLPSNFDWLISLAGAVGKGHLLTPLVEDYRRSEAAYKDAKVRLHHFSR